VYIHVLSEALFPGVLLGSNGSRPRPLTQLRATAALPGRGRAQIFPVSRVWDKPLAVDVDQSHPSLSQQAVTLPGPVARPGLFYHRFWQNLYRGKRGGWPDPIGRKIKNVAVVQKGSRHHSRIEAGARSIAPCEPGGRFW